MNNPKQTLRDKLLSHLHARDIKYNASNWQISTDFGDLIFEPKRICIRYMGQHGVNAAFRYSDNPNADHIIKMLMDLRTKKSQRVTRKPPGKAKLRWFILGFVFVAGCTASTLSFTGFSQKHSSAKQHHNSLFGQRNTQRGDNQTNDYIKPLSVEIDRESVIQNVHHFSRIANPDRIIQYKFDQDTWLYENLTKIGLQSQHLIIYDASTNFRIKETIIETGRGSEIAKRVFTAINAQFGGGLTLVQCKNASVISDKSNYDIC